MEHVALKLIKEKSAMSRSTCSVDHVFAGCRDSFTSECQMRGACEHGLVECKACGHFNEENSLDADFVVPELSLFCAPRPC